MIAQAGPARADDPADSRQMIANARDAFGLSPGCDTAASPPTAGDDPAGAPADIIVCGDAGARHRLSPEERRIAGVRRTPNDPIPAPDPLSREAMAETQNGLMKVSRLPHNWMSMGGRYGRPPAPNAALEQQRRAEAAVAGAEAERKKVDAADAGGAADAPPIP